MFKRLKEKWNVGGTKMFLILCVFAITGSATAFLTRQVTRWLNLETSSPWFWMIKILALILGYQLILLTVAIPFGQFKFFWNYEKKILCWFARLFKPRLP